MLQSALSNKRCSKDIVQITYPVQRLCMGGTDLLQLVMTERFGLEALTVPKSQIPTTRCFKAHRATKGVQKTSFKLHMSCHTRSWNLFQDEKRYPEASPIKTQVSDPDDPDWTDGRLSLLTRALTSCSRARARPTGACDSSRDL